MKVKIYKSGGSTGRFISKLERFLPSAAQGAQVDEMKQLKEAIKYQLDDKNQSASSVMLQLVRGGYDYGTAKSIVDTVEEELEDSYYEKKGKKDSMMDSDVIPNEDEIDNSKEDDRKKRKELSRNMQDDIAQTAQDTEDDDSNDDQEYEDMLNEGSPYDDNLATAAFGMQVEDSKIQWPGMFNDMSSFKNGGIPNKKKFINSTVKKLMKAKAGMEKDPTASEMPNPFGTIDDPRGLDLTPNKSIVSAMKGTAQNYVDEQAYKQQAEQMYNQQFMQPMGVPMAQQGGENMYAANMLKNDWATNLHNYGEALQHQMPSMETTGFNTSFEGQMANGGIARRMRRANKEFFGSPIALPGAKTDYEFGPLGGLRKGTVEYDLGQLGQALKINPELASMFMPQMAMGMPQFNPFGGSGYNNYGNTSSSSSYSSSSPQSRLKWETQNINSAADPSKNEEAGKLKNNPDQTDQKKKYQDYIDWWGAEPIREGESRQAPISFDEFTTKGQDGLSEYDHYAQGINASVSPTATVNAPVNVPGTTVTSPGSGTANTGKPKVVTKPGTDAPVSEPTVDDETVDAINNTGQKGKTSEELGLFGVDILYNKNRPDAGYVIKDGKYYISPQNSSDDAFVRDNWYEVTDPKRIEQIQTFKPSQYNSYQGLRGKDFDYRADDFGDWSYSKDGNNFNPVTNPQSLERLNNNESIGNDFLTLESKPGYYYRKRNDGAYVKFKGDPEKHNNSKKAIATITEKSDPKAFKYINANLNWGGGDPNQHSNYKPLGFKNAPGIQSKSKGPSTMDYLKMGYRTMNPTSMLGFEDGGFVDFERPDLNRFVYGGDEYEYEYGGDVRRFAPGGANEVDPNYRDAGGRNYQEYINWQGQDAVPAGRSRQAPQSYAEWKAEQDAEKNPAPTNTGTATTTQGKPGATNFDQAYFQNMFQSDPKFKQGFEQFLQSQGMPTNSQRQQQGKGNFQWTNNQGSQLVGTGPADRGFGSGILGAFGLNKDFKAYYSPQGQITREMIAQAMKNPANKVTETKFKDRGNRFNPFDNKKVTEWTINPSTGQPTPAVGTGTNNAPGYNPTAAGPGYSGYNADSDGNGMPDYLQMSESTGTQSGAPSMNQNIPLSRNSGSGMASVYEPDAIQANTAQNNMSSQAALSGVDGTQNTTANVSNAGVNQNVPNGMFLQTRQDGDYEAGVDSKGRLVSRGTPPQKQPIQPTAEQTQQVMNMFGVVPPFTKNSTGNYMDYRGSNPTMPSRPLTPGVANPMTDPKYMPTGEDFNYGAPNIPTGPASNMQNVPDYNDEFLNPLPMAYGGYMPTYMAYGGYMPNYNPGGTVLGPNPDFGGVQPTNVSQDKNGNNIPDYLETVQEPGMTSQASVDPLKYRLEEENAWSFDPRKAGRTLDTGLNLYTGLDKSIEFAKNREKENSEFMYAQDVDRQLTQKGLGDPNEGVWKQNIGFESGRTYASKYGGAKFAKGGSTYAKGKVYSLTMDEINEIKNRGGSVKFIK